MAREEIIAAPEEQRRLVQAFARALQAQGQRVLLHETHISWVLVTPQVAWKLKKAVRMGFIDATGLQARRHYCEEELRLNRRTAPALYLRVQALVGPPECPALVDDLDASGVLEYAVCMKSFDEDALWDRRIALGLLAQDECSRMGSLLGRFHIEAATAAGDSDWGSPATLLAQGHQNREELLPLLPPELQEALAQMGTTIDALHAVQARLREARRHDGRVREGHGDLHCGNILSLAGQPLAFDCIDFNPALRWMDVADDLAFALMDLRAHGLPLHAACLLDAWLQETGDYGCLPLLALAQAERALIRCKVSLLRAAQQESTATASSRSVALTYLQLAQDLLRAQPAARPPVILMHGLSGSGKSALAAALARASGALRLRSDVQRKRAVPIAAKALYSREARQAVYQHMGQQLKPILEAGYPAIVDAAFLGHGERMHFIALADRLSSRAIIIDCSASHEALRQRILARQQEGNDPSDADLTVLEQQLATQESLDAREKQRTISVDTSRASPIRLARELAAVLGLQSDHPTVSP